MFNGIELQTKFSSNILYKVMKLSNKLYMTYFVNGFELDLTKIRAALFELKLNGENKEITIRQSNGNIKKRLQLSYNTFNNILTYYDDSFTCQISKYSIKVFPKDSDIKNLNDFIKMFLIMENGGFLK